MIFPLAAYVNGVSAEFFEHISSRSCLLARRPHSGLSSEDAHGGKPISHGINITTENVNHIDHHADTGIHILHRYIALEAVYDSADSFPQPRCHPKTRSGMLKSLWRWAIRTEEIQVQGEVGRSGPISETARRRLPLDIGKPVLWLHGPAGAGKSAIMQTLCERLQASDRLGASFCFKRSHPTRGNAQVLFATLAYQLALQDPALTHHISNCVELDPSVVGRSMGVQLQKLIIEPCQWRRDDTPFTLLIDSLDECNSEAVQQEILRLLCFAGYEYPRMLRIIVASRPESHIREIFEGTSANGLFCDLNIGQSFTDVEIYLRSEFSRIHREHHDTMGTIPTPWPSKQIINTLVSRSSGYFIYAATVIKFIDDRDFRPTERLMTVVRNPTNVDRPFEALDQLYLQILSSAPARSRLLPILCAIIEGFSSRDIEELLELDPGDVNLTVRRLHSVLKVPSDDSRNILLYHESFRDFVADPARSGEFCVSTLERMALARSVLKAYSHMYDDRPLDRLQSSSQHVAWRLGRLGIDYVTFSIEPSADLLPFIGSVNPEFLWRGTRSYQVFERMINWLKKIEPSTASAEVIGLWEDYYFIRTYNSIFKRYAKLHAAPEIPESPRGRQGTSPSPQLFRVLQAFWIWRHACSSQFGKLDRSPSLYYLRLVLDIPWSDMHTLLSPLRSLKNNLDELQLNHELHMLLDSAKMETLSPEISRDLARGCIPLLKGIEAGDLPKQMWFDGIQWGRLVEDSLHCPKLLNDLRELDITGLRGRPFSNLAPGGRELGIGRLNDLIMWLQVNQLYCHRVPVRVAHEYALFCLRLSPTHRSM
ncbi:hypothetical protein B0H11DRAFT_2122972 [Mycena galericulata]|nr:hypothetical protein B0H11DRAFT_2122972 [Mycena galericulata]